MASQFSKNTCLPSIAEMPLDEVPVSSGSSKEQHRNSDTTLIASPTSSARSENVGKEAEEVPLLKGARLWLQVFSGFCIQFILGGWAGCAGLFLLHYAESLQRSEHDIAWITGLESFFGFLPSTLVGLACDKGYAKAALGVGGILISGGAVAVSFAAHSYIVLVLIQGVLMGVAKSLIWIPSTFVICSYFEPRRLPLAFALSKSGAGIGSMIFPVILECAQSSVGFENTLRIMGGVSFITCAVAYCSLLPRNPITADKRQFLHFAAFKKLPYCYVTASSFMMVIGGSAGMTFINTFGNDMFGLTEAQTLPINLIKEGVSIPAAAVSAWVAYRYADSLSLDILLTTISTICYFTWIAVSSVGGMYTWMVAKGVLHGGLGCIAMAVISQVVRSQKLFGSSPDLWGARLGMIATLDALSSLGGPLIFARLLALSKGSYVPGQLFCGFCLSASTAALVLLRFTFGRDMALERSKMYA